jgi:preprotein translocase subunit SecY
MSLRETTQDLFLYLPSVKRPEGHVKFKQKLLWTFGILVAYFALTNVPIWGLGTGGEADFLGQFRTILAGAQGSVFHLGIMPIVTASIVLQLLAGAELLGLDMSDPRDQQYFQSLQKVLVIVFAAVTAFPMVFAGNFLPADSTLATALGVGQPVLQFIMFAQITFGGILIMYLDEIVSKWGIGSGVGLFIVAGVAQQLFGGILNIGQSYISIFTGTLPIGQSLSDQAMTMILGPGSLLAIVTTVTIFYIVVYAESTRVELPVRSARAKGARGRFPVKLIYASVMPLILVRAIQANIQFIGRLLNSGWTNMPAWIGSYSSTGQPTGGLFYFLAPIQSPNDWMWFAASVTAEPWEILLRLGIDLTFMLIGGAIFAVFWVETTGMGADKSAQQLKRSGLQIPGFRNNTNVIEKVLERYIPYVTVIGGALVGLLAVLANLFGAIGAVSGTGLLLAVSITYKLYEEMAKEKMSEMNKTFRQFFENA